MGSGKPHSKMSYEAALSALVTMFRVRLVRRAYRHAATSGDLPQEVAACEVQFLQLVRSAVDQDVVDRLEWGLRCENLSNEWAHVCYWLHPGRLEDILTSRFGTVFKGKRGPVLSKEDRKQRKQVVRAQKYECAECGVVCNSYAQYETHERGQRHTEMLRQAAAGRNYTPKAPVPCSGQDGQGMYYVRDDTPPMIHSDGSSQSVLTVDPSRTPVEVQPRVLAPPAPTAAPAAPIVGAMMDNVVLMPLRPVEVMPKLNVVTDDIEGDQGPPTLASYTPSVADFDSPLPLDYGVHSPYTSRRVSQSTMSSPAVEYRQCEWNATPVGYRMLNPIIAMFGQQSGQLVATPVVRHSACEQQFAPNVVAINTVCQPMGAAFGPCPTMLAAAPSTYVVQ